MSENDKQFYICDVTSMRGKQASMYRERPEKGSHIIEWRDKKNNRMNSAAMASAYPER